MEEIKSFFTSRGLGTSELAKGLVIHEVDLLFFSNLPDESEENHISGAWGCHYVLSLGRMLFLETLGQVYFICRTSKEIENELNQSIKNTVLLLILFHRFMTVLKNKNHKHWKQAQARISMSPLASRISGYCMNNKNCEPSHH